MSVAASTLLGRPLWYELMTTDMSAADAFYRTVVGWTSSSFASSATRGTRKQVMPRLRASSSHGRIREATFCS